MNKHMSYCRAHKYLSFQSSEFATSSTYGQTMRFTARTRIVFASLVFVLIATSSVEVSSASFIHQQPQELSPTKVVNVYPKYGFSNGPLRVRLSHSEVDIVKRLQAASFAPTTYSKNSTDMAVFYIEPSAKDSPTLALGLQSMKMSGEILASPPDARLKKTPIIIGRSKEFIANTVRSLGCFPDFSELGGALLMGATICNRQVILINLTGYLFIKNRSQSLTSEMETWPEPPLSATSYLYADRNIGGLSHEWTHISRNYISHGFIADNEPAWFREGLAEIISGMSRVRASTNDLSYLNFHVIRIRKFARWPNPCNNSTHDYRSNGASLGGCEYLRGLIALELLVANYGGIPKIVNLYEDMRLTADFFASFQNVYKMSVAAFERRADNYFKYISQAATYKP